MFRLILENVSSSRATSVLACRRPRNSKEGKRLPAISAPKVQRTRCPSPSLTCPGHRLRGLGDPFSRKAPQRVGGPSRILAQPVGARSGEDTWKEEKGGRFDSKGIHLRTKLPFRVQHGFRIPPLKGDRNQGRWRISSKGMLGKT